MGVEPEVVFGDKNIHKNVSHIRWEQRVEAEAAAETGAGAGE